eukprot:gene32793-33860_t
MASNPALAQLMNPDRLKKTLGLIQVPSTLSGLGEGLMPEGRGDLSKQRVLSFHGARADGAGGAGGGASGGTEEGAGGGASAGSGISTAASAFDPIDRFKSRMQQLQQMKMMQTTDEGCGEGSSKGNLRPPLQPAPFYGGAGHSQGSEYEGAFSFTSSERDIPFHELSPSLQQQVLKELPPEAQAQVLKASANASQHQQASQQYNQHAPAQDPGQAQAQRQQQQYYTMLYQQQYNRSLWQGSQPPPPSGPPAMSADGGGPGGLAQNTAGGDPGGQVSAAAGTRSTGDLELLPTAVAANGEGGAQQGGLGQDSEAGQGRTSSGGGGCLCPGTGTQIVLRTCTAE